MDRQPSAPGASLISDGSGNLAAPVGGARGVIPPWPALFPSIAILLGAGPHRRRWHSDAGRSNGVSNHFGPPDLGPRPKCRGPKALARSRLLLLATSRPARWPRSTTATTRTRPMHGSGGPGFSRAAAPVIVI